VLYAISAVKQIVAPAVVRAAGILSGHLRTGADGLNFGQDLRRDPASVFCGNMKIPSSPSRDHVIEITRSVIIQRPASAVYRFWRDPANLQRISDARISISPTSATSSHWSVRIPSRRVEWDTDITRNTPDQEIAWETRAGAEIPNSGSVRFEPIEGQGTNITLTLNFHLPASFLGTLLGNVAKERIAKEIGHALERTKSQLEKTDPDPR
jgi:uncharacterized membrane protein